MKKPFFILGCVRSGTTFLRDVLRLHPNLVSPEETHFFRWSEPFGTDAALRPLFANSTLIKHREIDGVTEKEFDWLVKKSVSRADLYKRYMKRYLANNGMEGKRWFDKTPQNVYGAAMLLAEFPSSKLIHIVRDPMDVVTSLRVGKIVKVENIVGACNYWNEAAEIISVMKRAYPKRILELRYEDLLSDFDEVIKRVLEYVGEEYLESLFYGVNVVNKQYNYDEYFTERDIEYVNKVCGKFASRYGYTTRS